MRSPPDTKALCFRDVHPLRLSFVLRLFVWTDLVTTISRERLEQSQ